MPSNSTFPRKPHFSRLENPYNPDSTTNRCGEGLSIYGDDDG
ncbi:hypothetical protein ACFL07_03185 [Pseudomonadota bacterium]